MARRSFAKPRPRRGASSSQAPAAALELTIDKFAHDGRGIAKHAGKTVFVAGALPGETVKARLTRRHSRFDEARSEQLLSAESVQRAAPHCQHFARCGGCQLQHIAGAVQVKIKQQTVLEQLQRFAKIAPKTLLAPLHGGDFAYRTRARLGVWWDKNASVSLGFRRYNSRELVDIKQCPVLVPALEKMLAPLRTWLQAHRPTVVTHIELCWAHEQCAVIIRHMGVLPAAARSALAHSANENNWLLWLQPSKAADKLTDINGEPVNPRLSYKLDQPPLDVQFHPSDFTQVNATINRQMVAQALELLAPAADEHVVDLFCGIGNFTLALAASAARVTGIEAVEQMVARGRENAAVNGCNNIDFMAADLTAQNVKVLRAKIGQPDALLLDPPRAGASELCGQMGLLAPKRILYVSCNPATLARDAAQLIEAGYRLETLGIMDMFPQTAHIETMALFVRAR